MSRSYAVLIGVDRYPSLGAGATLRGAGHDARAWHGVCHGHLRIPQERCELLLGPALADAQAAIGRMAAWIRGQDAPATGILFFSGHGASVHTEHNVVPGDRLGLAFADAAVHGDELHGVLVLSRLEELLEAAGVAQQVTLVVDACYTTLQGASFASGLGRERHGPPAGLSRTLLGSGLWSPAYESHIAGTWRGVFSFALQTVLSQWRTDHQDGVTYVRGTYQEALFRARSVLQALGYDDQQPQLSGSLRAPMVPFNFPTLEPTAADSSPVPDGNRRTRELTGEGDTPGFWRFKLEDGNANVYKDLVLVANPSGSGVHCVVKQDQQQLADVAEGHQVILAASTLGQDLDTATRLTLEPGSASSTSDPAKVKVTLDASWAVDPGDAFADHSDDHWAQATAPNLQDHPTFGPFTMQTVPSDPGTPQGAADVYVEFDTSASVLKWWILVTGEPPGGDVLVGEVQLGANAHADRCTSVGSNTTWYLCSDADPLPLG